MKFLISSVVIVVIVTVSIFVFPVRADSNECKARLEALRSLKPSVSFSSYCVDGVLTVIWPDSDPPTEIDILTEIDKPDATPTPSIEQRLIAVETAIAILQGK